MGFPFKICFLKHDDDGAYGWGLFSGIPMLLGFNGWFYHYTGPYWKALREWLVEDI